MTSPNPFPPGASQVDMLTIILDSFPANGAKGMGQQQVGIFAKSRRPFAEQLHRRGVRVHVEDMTEYPIATSAQGGMSWLTPSTWVSRDDFERHLAEQARPAADKIAEFREQLRAADPDLAARLENMDDGEKRAAMEQQLQYLAQAAAYVERIRGELSKEDKPE